MEGMQFGWALFIIVGSVALLMMGLLLLLLLVRDQHLQGLLQVQCQLSEKLGQHRKHLEHEILELQAAFRAERTHVQQQRRKVQLLELLLCEQHECPE
jgi:hypothetical protein